MRNKLILLIFTITLFYSLSVFAQALEFKKEYYTSGALKKETPYIKDIRNGEAKEYYENGSIKMIEHYLWDLPSGTWQFFNEDGALGAEMIFENGKEIITKTYDKNGKITQLIDRTGKAASAVKYDESGKKIQEITFDEHNRITSFKREKELNDPNFDNTAKADLMITALDAVYFPGDGIQYEFTIKNIGEAGVPLSTYYAGDRQDISIQGIISADEKYDSISDIGACGGGLYDRREPKVLQPGESISDVRDCGNTNLDLEKTPYLIFMINQDFKIPESNYKNNDKAIKIRVGEGGTSSFWN
jgi:hypothetical protein